MKNQGAMTIEQEFITTHPKCQQCYRRLKELIPGGVSHDARYMTPFPLFLARGEGSKVWDVDGNEYIDYHPGMVNQLLGHRHPAIVAALTEQLSKGLEFGACDELEIQAAELIIEMVPCAEQVRFTCSGAEANELAIRLARAYTGKSKIIRFRGHWHGGFNEGLAAVAVPFDVPYSAGLTEDVFSNLLLADHNNIEDVRRFAERGDVAGLLLESMGAHTVVMPYRPGFLEEVRQITKEKGIVLISDEVFTNFRFAPGGAQEVTGIIPDLVTLGKPLGAGMPVSGVAGKKDIMQKLAFTGDSEYDRHHRVRWQGTHSGSPIALAATVANLEVLKTGEVQAQMNRHGAMLRKGLNEQIKQHNIPGCVYGHYSANRIFLNHNCPYLDKCNREPCINPDHEFLDKGMPISLRNPFRLAMFLNGINNPTGGGWLINTGAMTDEDIEKTVEAFDRSLARLKAEKIL